MAIQPIDLQTMFSQLANVGKAQAAMRDGQQIQESLHQAKVQQELEENVKSVNESQNMGEESGKIRDENRRGATGGGAKEKPESKAQDGQQNKKDTIRDPALGRNVDISR